MKNQSLQLELLPSLLLHFIPFFPSFSFSLINRLTLLAPVMFLLFPTGKLSLQKAFCGDPHELSYLASGHQRQVTATNVNRLLFFHVDLRKVISASHQRFTTISMSLTTEYATERHNEGQYVSRCSLFLLLNKKRRKIMLFLIIIDQYQRQIPCRVERWGWQRCSISTVCLCGP